MLDGQKMGGIFTATPRKRWVVATYALAFLASIPIVETLYYQRLLASGVLDTNADSIGIPIGQVIVGTVFFLPFLVGFLVFALRSYQGRVSLLVWDRDRPLRAVFWSVVFVAMAGASLRALIMYGREWTVWETLQCVLSFHLALVLRASVVGGHSPKGQHAV